MRCFANEATRWEAFLDLDGYGIRWSRSEGKSDPDFCEYLTPQHCQELLQFLEKATPDEEGMPYEVPFIMGILANQAEDLDLYQMAVKYREIAIRDYRRLKRQKNLIADFLARYKNSSSYEIAEEKQ